jgi:hypothetical protein
VNVNLSREFHPPTDRNRRIGTGQKNPVQFGARAIEKEPPGEHPTLQMAIAISIDDRAHDLFDAQTVRLDFDRVGSFGQGSNFPRTIFTIAFL